MLAEEEQLDSNMKGELNKALNFFKGSHRKDIHREAVARLPAWLLPTVKGLSDDATWAGLLRRRTRVCATDAACQDAFQKHSKEDRRRVRKRFPDLKAAEDRGDTTWQPKSASHFRRWCEQRSWQICAQCHRMRKRKLKERHLAVRTCQPTIKMCRHCKSGIGYRTVQKEDIPELYCKV